MGKRQAKTTEQLRRIYEEGLVGNGPSFEKLTEGYKEKRKSTEGFGVFKDFEPFKKPKPRY